MFNIIATFHEPHAFTAAEREQREIETTELSNGHAETNNNTINNEKEEKFEDFKYIQVIKNSSIFLTNRIFVKKFTFLYSVLKLHIFV